MMRVRVRLFAAHREAAGRPFVEVDLPATARVADLRAALSGALPALGRAGLPVVVAVNGEFARDERTLRTGDDIAVFPPVSGG